MEKLVAALQSRTRLAVRAAKAGQLAALAAASGLLYWLLVVRPANLLALYPFPRQDLHYLWDRGEPARWRLALAFVVLSLLYGLAYWIARRARGRAAWLVVIAGGLIFASLLSFLQPIDSADIYDNILHGRILGIYQNNPFQQLGREYPQDPFYRFAAWKSAPSAYGPLWEILAGAAARLAGDGILANVMAFKLLAGLFWLGSLLLSIVALQAAGDSHPLANFLLLAWNPFVLYAVWGNGHNDMALVFWVLFVCVATLKRRFLVAVLALMLGALVKFIPLLLLPPLVVEALRAQATRRARIFFLLKACLAAAILVYLAYAPFWQGADTLSIPRRMQLFSASLPASVYQLLMPWLDSQAAARSASLGALALTGVFVLWRSFSPRPPEPQAGKPAHSIPENQGQNSQWLVLASFDILAFYLLVTCLWFQAWYALWLVGLAPLLKDGHRQRLALLFAFAMPFKQLVVAPELFWPRPHLQQPWLEIVFTLGVLGLPWLYTIYALWEKRVSSRNPEGSYVLQPRT